jgi:hypothetical protein
MNPTCDRCGEVNPADIHTCTPKAQPAPLSAVSNAMQTVIGAMQTDPGYAWSWHCNVAMAFVDAGGDHYTANQGAARFMRLLANVEPTHELPTPPAAQPAPVQEVSWGVEWGRAGDTPCVSIIKRLPDGDIQVVAVEYAPYAFKEKP